MVKRTERDIFRAFDSLIHTNHFHELTVQKICEEAGVSKATFYRYFMDKFDVLDKYMRTELSMFQHRDGKADVVSDLTELFQYARDNEQLVQRAFEGFSSEAVKKYIRDYAVSFSESIISERQENPQFTEEEKVIRDLFCNALPDICEGWVKGDYTLSPREAAAALYKTLPIHIESLDHQD